MTIHNDVHSEKKWHKLYQIFKTLGQDDRDRIDTYGKYGFWIDTYGKYGFWALDHSHPREDRLALAMKDLGIYDYIPDALEKFEMAGGAEEYDEIMAAHELMNVR